MEDNILTNESHPKEAKSSLDWLKIEETVEKVTNQLQTPPNNITEEK